MRASAFFAACAAAMLFASPPAAAQAPQSCTTQGVNHFFEPWQRTGRPTPEIGMWLHDPKAQYIEPYEAFPNVWYVGICWVSAWAIKTRDGVILIDTLHEPHGELLVDNLRKAGIAPGDIRYVLITHGHYDHAGGAYKLKPLAPAKFLMTKQGWEEAAGAAKASQAGPRPWTMIEPEGIIKDGDVIRLGDAAVTVLETPGHSWGTASYAFDVKDGARVHRAITVGGLALNAISGSKQVEAYIASIDRLAETMTSATPAYQAHLTTHAFSNGLMESAQRLKARRPGEPHPLVDPAGFLAQLKDLRAAAVRRLEIEKQAGR
jgi:metallo-beta-lactamase class B